MSRDSQAIARLIQGLLRKGSGRVPARWLVLGCVLLAGYLFATPWLEQRLGVDLPGIAEWTTQPATRPTAEKRGERTERPGANPDAPDAATVDSLLRSHGQVYTSPAGLRFSRGTQHGHHLRHLMAHSQDEPRRPVHGVFDAKGVTEVLDIVDQAYRMALSHKNVSEKKTGDRTIYVVDMGRRIGYVGGESGQRRGHPPAEHLQLVVVGKKFITAYPMTPR